MWWWWYINVCITNLRIYIYMGTLYVCLLILLNKTTSFLLLFKYTRV